MTDGKVAETVRRRRVQSAVRFFGVARMTIGATFMLAPKFSSRRLLASHSSRETALTFGRMAAGRDFALGLGTLLANVSGTDSEFEWLVAGIIADSVDLFAFVKDDSCRLLPRFVSGLVAAGAVGLGAWTLFNTDALRTPSDDSDGEDN